MAEQQEKMMTFVEHLEELRTRLKYSVYALVICIAVAYLFSETLFALLAQPLIKAWSTAGLGIPQLHFANPLEPFFTYMYVSLIGGLMLATPIIFYQIWQFVAPGLYKREKRYVLPFTFASALLFVGGALFGYFFVFPVAFKFFLGFARNNASSLQYLFDGAVKFTVGEKFILSPTLMMGEYFDLVWKLLLSFGLVFELPVLIFFLSLVGVVTYQSLWRFNRYFILLAFVIGGVLTPGPDVISQLFMAIPLIVLYNLSIFLSWLITRKKIGPSATTDSSSSPSDPPG